MNDVILNIPDSTQWRLHKIDIDKQIAMKQRPIIENAFSKFDKINDEYVVFELEEPLNRNLEEQITGKGFTCIKSCCQRNVLSKNVYVWEVIVKIDYPIFQLFQSTIESDNSEKPSTN